MWLDINFRVITRVWAFVRIHIFEGATRKKGNISVILNVTDEYFNINTFYIFFFVFYATFALKFLCKSIKINILVITSVFGKINLEFFN